MMFIRIGFFYASYKKIIKANMISLYIQLKFCFIKFERIIHKLRNRRKMVSHVIFNNIYCSLKLR